MTLRGIVKIKTTLVTEYGKGSSRPKGQQLAEMTGGSKELALAVAWGFASYTGLIEQPH